MIHIVHPLTACLHLHRHSTRVARRAAVPWESRELDVHGGTRGRHLLPAPAPLSSHTERKKRMIETITIQIKYNRATETERK